MSPAYDVPTTLPYDDSTFALSVGGRTSGLSRRRLLSFAGDIGLRLGAAERVLDRLVAGPDGFGDELATGLPFTPGAMRRVAATLERRRREASPISTS